MGKRKRQPAELPLFDLPLQPEAGEAPAVGELDEPSPGDAVKLEDAVLSGDATAPADELTPARAPELGHDADEDGAGARKEQLELVDLAGPAAGAEAGSAEPAEAAEAAEDRALLGDRLLGGLADLVVQLVTSGLALAAAHSLGVAVGWADWMPFAVFALVFSFLYWMVPLAFWGHTPGMAWVGHSARAAGGEPLTFGQAFRRWLGALFTMALAGLPLLLAWTGRSFSDRISDSYTVAEA